MIRVFFKVKETDLSNTVHYIDFKEPRAILQDLVSFSGNGKNHTFIYGAIDNGDIARDCKVKAIGSTEWFFLKTIKLSPDFNDELELISKPLIHHGDVFSYITNDLFQKLSVVKGSRANLSSLVFDTLPDDVQLLKAMTKTINNNVSINKECDRANISASRRWIALLSSARKRVRDSNERKLKERCSVRLLRAKEDNKRDKSTIDNLVLAVDWINQHGSKFLRSILSSGLLEEYYSFYTKERCIFELGKCWSIVSFGDERVIDELFYDREPNQYQLDTYCDLKKKPFLSDCRSGWISGGSLNNPIFAFLNDDEPVLIVVAHLESIDKDVYSILDAEEPEKPDLPF